MQKKYSKRKSKKVSRKKSSKRKTSKKGGSQSYADKVEKFVLGLRKEYLKEGSGTYWKLNGMKKKYFNKTMDEMNKLIKKDAATVLKKSKGLVAKVTRSVYTREDDSNNKRHGIYFILTIIIFKLDKKTGMITKENHSSSSVNWKENDFHDTTPHEKLIDKLVDLTIEKKFTATSLLGVSLDVAIKDLKFSDVDISDLFIPLE